MLWPSAVVFWFWWFWSVAGPWCCSKFWLKIWYVSFAAIRLEFSYSSSAVFWGLSRASPPCLRGRASICLSASLTRRPTSAGISWFPIAFSSGLNRSVKSKRIQLEHIPLVNVEHVHRWKTIWSLAAKCKPGLWWIVL